MVNAAGMHGVQRSGNVGVSLRKDLPRTTMYDRLGGETRNQRSSLPSQSKVVETPRYGCVTFVENEANLPHAANFGQQSTTAFSSAALD